MRQTPDLVHFLIVDDSVEAADLWRGAASAGPEHPEGTRGPRFDVDPATSTEAPAWLSRRHYDVLIVNRRHGAWSGLALLHHFRGQGIEMPAILLTAPEDEVSATDAASAGAVTCRVDGGLTADSAAVILRRGLALLGDRALRRAAQEARSWLAAIVESAEMAIIGKTLDGIVMSWNAGAERLSGYSAAEALGRPIGFFAPADRQAEVRGMLATMRAGEKIVHLETVRLHKDGTAIQVALTVSPVRGADGGIIGASTIARDVTDRKAAEQALRQSEERYRALFELSPLPMWAYDPETLAIVEVNAAAVQHYGYTRGELLAMTLRDIRPPDDVPKLLAVDRSSESRRHAGVWRHRRKDGSLIDVDVYTHEVTSGGRYLRIAVLRDVTEQKKLEEQLRLAQKMEAIGRLASGIAHDFNNLLTAILGYCGILTQRESQGLPYGGEIEEIRRAGERAAALTRQLLALSRQQVMSPEVIDLSTVVADIEGMLRRIIGEDLDLVTVLASGLGRVKADRGQIEQVIMNLVVNARDAMPGGGRLTIETRNIELDDDYARRHIAVQPGSYVVLAVSDTGVGMSEEVQSHIFEPFYTTKERGKGTGLGLSTTFGIVKQSGGNIWVYSEPGRGTTFKIYLPRVEEPLAVAARDAPAEAVRSLRGDETILLAEDDDTVRLLARIALESYGYTVLAANGGEQALEILDRRSGTIHLLVTDMLMPGMIGTELASRVTALRPEIKILFMSGYTDNAIAGHEGFAGKVTLVEKPFTIEGLAGKVREVLNG
jgi:two-component system cell cycle sensor histidine kinase/response regulator CckA